MATWKKDILSSTFFLAVLGIFVYGGSKLKETAWAYPRALVILCGVCTLILLIRGILGRTKEAPAPPEDTSASAAEQKAIKKQTVLSLIICGLSMIAYIICIEYIGYLLSTFLFIAGLLLFLRVRKWWIILAVSLGVSGLIFYMFNNLLLILLPTGSLFL